MKIGVIGGGRMGFLHSQKLLAAGLFGGVYDTKDDDEPLWHFLQHNALDGVVIATPTATHLTVAKEVADYNLPMLVEKPIAANLEDALELALLPAVMVGHIERYSPAWQHAKTLIAPEHEFHMERTGPKRDGDYGSVLMDSAVHDLDLMASFAGLPYSGIRAYGDYAGDAALGEATFGSGTRASFVFSRGSSVNSSRRWFSYQDGVDVEIDFASTIVRVNGVPQPFDTWDKLEAEHADFVNFIDTGTIKTGASGMDGYRAVLAATILAAVVQK